MNLKKTFAIFLALALAVALFTACGDKETGSTDQPAGSPAPAPEASAPASQAPASPAPAAPSDNQPAQQPETAPETPSVPAGPPIRIGHIVDLQGVEAATGEECKRALEFAVESLGGVIAGHPVEIIIGDAQNQPSVAVDVARKMVEQDGVVAIFGPTQIGQKSAVAEYMKEAGIPLIFYNPTPVFLTMGNPWVVGSGGSTPQMPTVMADYIYNDMGYRTIDTLAPDNTGARSFIDPLTEAFEALGGTIVQQQWHPVPCPDFAPYLIALNDADALVAWTSGGDAIALWGTWFGLGVNEKMPMVAAMHGGFTDYFVPTALSHSNPGAAEAMLGALAPMMYTPGIHSPENDRFVAEWTAAYGQAPGGTNLPGDCTQAVYLFNAAMESINGDTDPENLIQAIFSIDFTGPSGHISFDGNSQVATKDVHIVRVVHLPDGTYSYEVVKEYLNVPPSGLTH